MKMLMHFFEMAISHRDHLFNGNTAVLSKVFSEIDFLVCDHI